MFVGLLGPDTRPRSSVGSDGREGEGVEGKKRNKRKRRKEEEGREGRKRGKEGIGEKDGKWKESWKRRIGREQND